MLKVYNYNTTFSEFPNEISLCLHISQCPNKCVGCSEPWLWGDEGTELSDEYLEKLIKDNPYITLIGIMGGDNDPEERLKVCKKIKSLGLKVGVYSGKDYMEMSLLGVVDFYKIGRWIMPIGNAEEWHKHSCGPIRFTYSNQRLFEIKNGLVEDVTQELQKVPVNNPNRYIIKESDHGR